jgi:putative FmdB family regulatory protein
MPTYDYRCRRCGEVFEVFHSMSDDRARRCPTCRARADRMIGTGAGLLFKGSGFYVTDYRSSSYREKAKQDSGGPGAPSSPGASGAGSAAGAPSKPASAPPAKPKSRKPKPGA